MIFDGFFSFHLFIYLAFGLTNEHDIFSYTGCYYDMNILLCSTLYTVHHVHLTWCTLWTLNLSTLLLASLEVVLASFTGHIPSNIQIYIICM